MNQYHKEIFEALPFVKQIRHLRAITGASRNCGWVNDETAFLLYLLVKYFKPEIVIQTGHLWGKSAVMVLEALNDGFLYGSSQIEDQAQNADKTFDSFVASNSPLSDPGRLISIDPSYCEVPFADEGIAYLKQTYSNFQFMRMTSNDFFSQKVNYIEPKVASQRLMGIVDGDHSWQGCLADLENLRRLNAKIIFVDDGSWIPCLRKLCRLFAEKEGYDFVHFSPYSGSVILIKREKHKDELAPEEQRNLPFWMPLAYRLGGRGLVQKLDRVNKRVRGLLRKVLTPPVGNKANK
jgi:hypothetical protein